MSNVIGPIHLSDWIDMVRAREKIKILKEDATKYELHLGEFLNHYNHLKNKYSCA